MALLRSFRKNRLRFAFEAAEPKSAPQESTAGEQGQCAKRKPVPSTGFLSDIE